MGITQSSTLRSLAELIEAISQDWPTNTTESAMNKAVAESKLLQVVGTTIVRDLNEMEAAFRKRLHDAVREVAIELAIEESLRSSPDQMVKLNDAEIMRTLLRPVPSVLVLERLAHVLEIELPEVVSRAAAMQQTVD